MKRYFFSIVVVAIFQTSLVQAADRVALVIGQANYRGVGSLPQATADTDAIVSTLEQLNFEATEVVDGTRSGLTEALAQFAERAAGAQVAVLYYSGYGIAMGQDNYLLPVDAPPSTDTRIRLEGIALQDVISTLAGAKTKLVLVNTASNNPFLLAAKSATVEVQAANAFAAVGDAGPSLFVSQAQTLASGADELSAYANGVIEALGQPDTDLATALVAMTAKIEANGAGKVVHYGNVPAGLHLNIEIDGSDLKVPDPAAYFTQLGDTYRDGKDGEKNPAMALAMYLKAAAHGASDRAAVIAEMYDTGSGTPRDPAEATKWYMKAGAEGEYQIALRYEFGYGIPLGGFEGQEVISGNTNSAKYIEALKYYTSSAEHGYPRAQWRLGLMYYYGKNYYEFAVDKDVSLALKWYWKAAESGYAPAMSSLARAYLDGTGVPKDIDRARRWYTQAIEAGDTRAYLYMAVLEESQSPPNYQAALGWWYKKSVETDAEHSTYAMEQIASYYSQGLGVKRDYKEALKWYRKAADNGDGEAMNSIGVMYSYGRGVPMDFAKAGEWYEKAATSGYSYANLNLASVFSRGQAGRKDIALAVKLAELAVRKNEESRDAIKSGWSNWPPEFLQAFQRRLSELGLYNGKIDGHFGSGTLAAIDALTKGE
ncbi:MAG: caspase family protein [Shinella zoogloeoides]|uniref:caspase family protein n=1 Tax=Shinella zoogloeoides TaxID=352475 RepID=UPI003C73751C